MRIIRSCCRPEVIESWSLPPVGFGPDATTREVLALVQDRFAGHRGSLLRFVRYQGAMWSGYDASRGPRARLNRAAQWRRGCQLCFEQGTGA